jgi:putative molybdopterin biosynthesis protein
MDGIAVRSTATLGARNDRPLRLVEGQDFVYIDTGEPLPEGFDAVIMIEQVNEVSPGEVEIYEAAFPGQHVRDVGEDFREGEVVVPQNFRLTPEAIAALINTRNFKLHVKRKPKGLFIPTGSELRPPDASLGEAGVPESNSQIFKGYFQAWGGDPEAWPIVEDRYGPIKEALLQAVEGGFDLIAVGAGTSKGREDFTAAIIDELGQVLVHGVGIAPGKPVILGLIEDKPVLGLPGYPVAAWVCIVQFIKPLLERYFGCRFPEPPKVKAKLARKVPSSLGMREFVRVKLDGDLARPLPGGSSRLSSLLRADGIVEISEEVEGLERGAEVEVWLLQ